MSDELIRERDFYLAKMQELVARVKVLEGDNAELQKRDADVTARLQEIANIKPTSYRPRYRPPWAPDTGPKMEIETNNTAATVAAIMVRPRAKPAPKVATMKPAPITPATIMAVPRNSASSLAAVVNCIGFLICNALVVYR